MLSNRTVAAVLAAALTGALATAGTASAIRYPPPAKPESVKAPKGPFETHTVCRKGCEHATVQAAVNDAGPGDTVRVKPGTYAERVAIRGAGKRHLKLIGDPKNPAVVVLDGKRFPAGSGVTINGAAEVEVNGFTARGYSANGFFVVNATGYRLTNLIANHTGVYGIYAFNSVGGEMSDSTAAWNNDAGFYIGQTPPQRKPRRSIVRNVQAYGNVLGFSGTNMRYVTITKSRWFNNGLGIVPNALDSEKYAPPEDNVISDNDIFFNNFNYFAGAPFRLGKSSVGVEYPVGTGVLLFGSHRSRVENNRIYGNYLVGVGALQQIFLAKQDPDDAPKAKFLIGNRVTGNSFGNGGANLNGRDLLYDGSGRDNCVDTTGSQNNVPLGNGVFRPCPFSGANTVDGAAFAEAARWATAIDRKKPDTAEIGWIRNPQAPVAGVTMMTRWTSSVGTP